MPENDIVDRIIKEVKEKPWTVPEKRAEIVARLKSTSDEIDRKIVTEIRSFRPMGVMSELGALMGAKPKKGVRIVTIMGDTVFDEKRVPSKERVDRWDAEHKEAERIRGLVPEYAFSLEARPNTVTGNFRVVEHARRLKAQGLLTPEEENILDALERYWQAHPELDREKGYGVWAYNLEIMVPERLRAKEHGTGIEKEIESIRDILKKEPWQMTRSEAIAEVAKPLGPMGISWGEMRTALSTSRQFAESLHKDMVKLAIVEGKPVPPEVLNEYPDMLSKSLKEEKEKSGGTGMAEQERPPSQEVRDWMRRALGIEDYKGGRHDRIQMLALLIQNSELGNIRSIHDAGSMALALGKDLGYGTPPAYGISFQRYYAEKIAAETGREVPIIKSSAIIKPPLKQVDPEAIASKFLEGYNRFSLKAVSEQKDEGVASELTVQFEGLSREDALKIAPQVRAIAAARAKEMEEQEIKARPPAPEVPKVDFWGMVKDLKITDVQVEFAPGDPRRGYKNIYLYTYAILENGKRVRMDEEIFKGTDVAKARKLGLEQFRQRKLYMIGETVGKNVRESTFIDLNRYEDYVKQAPVPVQKWFEEPGAIAGGATARQILTVTEPEEYYFGTQVEVMQGADPELEPYFTGTVKRLLNNGELVEVHPEGDPREASVRVPVDRVNVTKLVTQGVAPQKPRKARVLIFSGKEFIERPDGYIDWDTTKRYHAPHITIERTIKTLKYRGIPYEVVTRELSTTGVLETVPPASPAAPPAEQPSPGVQAMFNAYIRSTVLHTGALASPKFLSDERMAQDIERNIQVSKEEARALVPQFRAIAEKIINKEEIESVKELFGIDVEQEAHNLGIDLADYVIIKAGSRVFLQHKTIVQRRYEIKSPAGFMKKQEEETQERLREAQRRKALTVPPATPPAAKPVQSIQEIKEQVISSIQVAMTVEELQPILKGIGFLPLPEPEKRQLMDLYQNKYSLLLSERPFGVPVKTEEKPTVIGAPTRQQIVEAEQRRRAEESSRLRGQIPLVGGAATAARLEKFEPGAMEKARAEAEARKRIEQLGLPYGIHPVIKRLAESQQEVLKFGNKRAKDTVEDIVLRKYVQYCPPGTIIDNRAVPKVPEKWWVYPPKLRTCITQVEQKLAGEGMIKEQYGYSQRYRYSIYQDRRLFANEDDPTEANNIYEMLVRTYPKSVVELRENLVHPLIHQRTLKQYPAQREISVVRESRGYAQRQRFTII